MESPIIGGLLAFLGGAVISVLNFRINLRTLKKDPSALSYISVVRQFLNVGYLVAVFFLAQVLPWDYVPLLAGAAIGLTIPSFLLALRLAKINDALSVKKNDPPEKGADENG